MLAPTHGVFGVFLTLIFLAVFGVQWGLHWSIILFAVIGSILPDIDHPRSTIGRLFSFISIPLERKYGHRTVTHSLVGLVIASILFAFCVLLSILIFGLSPDLAVRWMAAFSISYFSHILLDMLNPRGSQMFWPDTGRDVIPKNPKFRPESGAKVEYLIFAVLFIFMILAFPISKFGIVSSLHWLLATPGSAIEEFKTMKTHSYVDFKGIINETREPVTGKAEILGVTNKRLVILYDNNVCTLSDEIAADIIASNVRVKKTTIPIKIEQKEFENASQDYLLSRIPKGALISGVIHLPDGMDINIPASRGGFKTIEQKGNDLSLSYASRSQLEKLTFSRKFDLQIRQDRAELSGLYARAKKIKSKIADIESNDDLTPLGKQLLVDNEDQDVQLAESISQLEEVNVKIEELRSKINDRRPLFSGEVYIRQ